jgi:hypothetical protein
MATREEHLHWVPSSLQREEGRQVLMNMAIESARVLLAAERPRAAGEPLEPPYII